MCNASFKIIINTTKRIVWIKTLFKNLHCQPSYENQTAGNLPEKLRQEKSKVTGNKKLQISQQGLKLILIAVPGFLT